MTDITLFRRARKLAAPVLALVVGFSVHAAEPVYVQSRQARLLDAPEFNAALVVTLEKGAALNVLEQQGRWLKVTYQEHQGWVPELLVGNRAPMDKMSVVNDEASDLKQSARRRASATTSTAAARGLRSDDRARQSDDDVADYSALTEMESFSVSDDEAQEFLDSGMK